MPSYEICYLNADGSLAFTLSALCADETQAKVMAHAMKSGDFRRFEVWRGGDLVYVRPAGCDERETGPLRPPLPA